MAAKKQIFQNILDNAQKKGIVNNETQASIKWFQQNVRKTTYDPSRLIREEKDSLVNSWTNVGIGKLYFVFYDPKHKQTLPYYDRFPLIIPIHRYNNGILGLNLHYLAPIQRVVLLDALYDTLTNTKFDDNTRMKVTYGLLNNAAKYKHFKPCVKRYLGNHFRSRFIKLHPTKWTPAVFLPVETFEKKSKKGIWQDSRKIITAGK